MRRSAALFTAACATLAAACSADRAGVPSYRDGVHGADISDPRSPGFHGTMLRATRWVAMLDANDSNACGRCHDGAPSRPSGVTTAAPGAPSCTSCHDQPGGALACSTCHGSVPRSGAASNAGIFSSDVPTSGAHAAHAKASPVHSSGFACSTCHPVPGSPVIGGLHGNGSVEIIFDPSVVPGEASYDRVAGNCAVSCHDRGGARPRLAWNDTRPVGCGDCHGSPPRGHYPGGCNRCHAEANTDGTALSPGLLHLNGKVDLGDGSSKCGACHGHGDSPWPNTAAHAAHQNPTLAAPIPCGTCHVVPSAIIDPMHLGGSAQVVFSGLAKARGAFPTWDGARCASVACHGANLHDPAAAPQWTDPSGAQSKCGACHGIPPTQHTPSTSCDRGDCHASEVSYDPSGTPVISMSGKALHVDGIIESAR